MKEQEHNNNNNNNNKTNRNRFLLTIGGQFPLVLVLLLQVVVLGSHGLHVAPVSPSLALAAGMSSWYHCV